MTKRYCLITVHDVSPQFEAESMKICSTLHRQIAGAFTAGIVPNWHGRHPLTHAVRFCEELTAFHCERSLHGFTHQSGRLTLTGILTGSADELNCGPPSRIAEILANGQQMLQSVFGVSAQTLTPPAWQFPGSHDQLLRSQGLKQVQRYHSIDRLDRPAIPLCTYSWDCGRLAALGWIGQLWGSILSTTSTTRHPCVVFHPRDIHTGFFTVGLNIVSRLLDAGYTPRTISAVAEEG